jgi:hypothetical protein
LFLAETLPYTLDENHCKIFTQFFLWLFSSDINWLKSHDEVVVGVYIIVTSLYDAVGNVPFIMKYTWGV